MLKGSSAASPESFVKTQPSHRLFRPHPRPRPRLPFPGPDPPAGICLHRGRRLRRRGGRAPAWPGHSPLTLLGDGPGDWVSLPRGRSGRLRPSTGPQEVSKMPEGGAEAPKWKAEKTPPSLSPGPLPPSGQEAPGGLPSKRPPHTNTYKHTHTVHRGLAWRGRGRKRAGRKGSRLPFQAGSRAPEKVFPPKGDRTSTGRVSRTPKRETGAEGRRAPSWKSSGPGSAEEPGPQQPREVPELEVKDLPAGSFPDPIRRCTVWLPW